MPGNAAEERPARPGLRRWVQIVERTLNSRAVPFWMGADPHTWLDRVVQDLIWQIAEVFEREPDPYLSASRGAGLVAELGASVYILAELMGLVRSYGRPAARFHAVGADPQIGHYVAVGPGGAASNLALCGERMELIFALWTPEPEGVNYYCRACVDRAQEEDSPPWPTPSREYPNKRPPST